MMEQKDLDAITQQEADKAVEHTLVSDAAFGEALSVALGALGYYAFSSDAGNYVPVVVGAGICIGSAAMAILMPIESILEWRTYKSNPAKYLEERHNQRIV